MASSECDVLVVGAGAAGLAAARTLESAGRQVVVAEAGDCAGGVMGTSEVDGFVIEHGPNTFLVKAPAHRFLLSQDLTALLEKASPASRKRQLFHEGRLVDVPMGPVDLVRTSLLSGAAKRRLLREPFVAPGAGREESVAQFMARRLGPEIVSSLVGPFLTGVYAGDESQLGAEAVFPALVELEREHGSLVKGGLASAWRSMRGGKQEPGALRGTHSIRGGLRSLVAALASPLRELRLRSPLRELHREAQGWRVMLGEGERLQAGSVLLATPAPEAAKLLGPVCAEAATTLGGIEYAPIATVALGVDPADLRTPAEGFGFLVPRAAGLGLLGCLFMSRLFEGRAPEGKLLLHCMVGGVRWPDAISLPDDLLTKRVCEDLDTTLGLRADPQRLMIRRWPRAVAQPGVGHPARIAAARSALRATPGLELAGSYADGVSLADTLASGMAAAERLLSEC